MSRCRRWFGLDLRTEHRSPLLNSIHRRRQESTMSTQTVPQPSSLDSREVPTLHPQADGATDALVSPLFPRLIAEAFGTFVLVFAAIGTALFLSATTGPFHLLALDATMPAIAAELFMTTDEVKYHVDRLRGLFGVKSRAALIAAGFVFGLLATGHWCQSAERWFAA
jgi:hypothetical protein